MSERAILTARALTVGYNGRAVVEGVELQALPGKILTLIGPNGAGKSTILKTLLHQLPPLSGQVLLDGRSLDTMTEREIARLSAAVLTERPEPELMTCADVVRAGRYPYTGRLGILSRTDRQRVREAMELIGVDDLADRDFNRISDGQRQRVMLARAIAQEPKVLIMDEPTSYLDIRHKLEFLHLLEELKRRQHLAVILSLHELDLAQKFSDTVLCVDGGRIQRAGTPEEIFETGYIESLYGVERGRYDPRFGSVEPAGAEGAPLVFVLGGGGSGVGVYRRLRRLGVPFAAGILPENDMDLPVAAAFASALVTVPPFAPVSAAALERAMELLARCRWCIDCRGGEEEAARRLAALAAQRNMLLEAEDPAAWALLERHAASAAREGPAEP